MLSDHAAGILAGRTRLGTEARGSGGEAQRQLALGENPLAHEICQRHLGGRNEPSTMLHQGLHDRKVSLKLR